MAGQVNIGGTSGSVQLVGNDSLSADQQVGFPDTSGANSTVVVTPTDQVIETSGGISHPDNTGDPNIELNADGTTSIKGIQGAAVNPNLLDNSSFRVNERGIWDSATGGGFMCDRWSCGNRNGWAVERGLDSVFNTGLGPLGAYAIKCNPDGSADAQWEQGIELANDWERTGTHVNPVAYPGCKYVLSVWVYRPTQPIDAFQAKVGYRERTNIGDGEVVFFYDNMTRTSDSVSAGSGATWYRYQASVEVTSDAPEEMRCLYVGFFMESGDMIAAPKLERGTVYTPWQPEPRPLEEVRCQRYYWYWDGKIVVSQDIWSATGTETRDKYGTIQFPVGMSRTPTAITSNSGNLQDVSRWSATYKENGQAGQLAFCTNMQAQAEMTDFDTWRA